MATTYKVLGQSAPSATTNTNIYTVPAGTQAVISTISVCNRTSGELTFRIAVRPNGATISNEHYIAYDSKVSGADTLFITVGITADAGDVITVYASSANLSFNVYGSEIA
jgi:hypothetical protein